MKSRRYAIIHPMNGHSARALLAAAGLLAVACGGDSGGPSAPSPVTTSSVSVTYPEDPGTIYIGDEVQFRATVSSSGSGPQAATDATWESDAPAVATVSSAGLVTAVSAGEATISAEVSAGGRGSRRIRVFPEFDGYWEGDLNVTSITVPPDWQALGEKACNGLPACASWIPLTVDFTQDGATVTGSVTSTFSAPPNYEWTVQSATVSIDGTLSLTSGEIAFRLPDDTVEIRARVVSWESRADTPGVMTGTAAVQYSSDTLSGNPVLEGCFEADNVIRECSGWRRERGVGASSNESRGLLFRTRPAITRPYSERGRSASCSTASREQRHRPRGRNGCPIPSVPDVPSPQVPTSAPSKVSVRPGPPGRVGFLVPAELLDRFGLPGVGMVGLLHSTTASGRLLTNTMTSRMTCFFAPSSEVQEPDRVALAAVAAILLQCDAVGERGVDLPIRLGETGRRDLGRRLPRRW